MLKSLLFLFILKLLLPPFYSDDNIVMDKKEAQQAFILLNDIRTHPDKYRVELKLNKNLDIKMTKLTWSNKLAGVAESKAYDMARRNYFSHTDPDGYGINFYINKAGYKLNADWIKDKSDNTFESIIAGIENGRDAIKTLIIDSGEPSFGHRNHLLGIGEWNNSLVDIGIGFAKRDSGSDYTTYVSIIIAKHDW